LLKCNLLGYESFETEIAETSDAKMLVSLEIFLAGRTGFINNQQQSVEYSRREIASSLLQVKCNL
jgi:hypothetical protein